MTKDSIHFLEFFSIIKIANCKLTKFLNRYELGKSKKEWIYAKKQKVAKCLGVHTVYIDW